MTRSALFLFVFAIASAGAAAQAVVGTVTSGGVSVPLATVRALDTAGGAAADADGRFQLRLPGAGTYTISVSAIGYTAVQQLVTVAQGETARVDVELEVATYESGAVVVTGTLEQMGVRESPVKVDVVPARFLETTPTANVMDAVERVNGLYQQVDCGVCNTNNIRINGIDGPNTAVLIDGMPVMSSLAMVYGLNGISPILIKQVEVVKGPMSTLYGSEALGGVINIITKDPSTAPRLSTNTFTTSRGELAAEFAAAPLRGRTSALVSGTVSHNGTYSDANDDGFADVALGTRFSLFGKVTHQDTQGFERASLVAKVYSEDRNGGVQDFFSDTDGLRGSGSVYGESIYTRRAEFVGSLVLHPDLTLRASAAAHAHDSFYGDTGFDATQVDGFGQLVYTPPTEGTRLDGHKLLVGAALRAIRYDDDSNATGRFGEAGVLLENEADNRLVPGLFVQDDWRVSDQVRLLGGFRVDYQPEHGVIPSPRAAVKVQPTETTTARFNVGTGFRIVNLFTEDHSSLTGGRATLVLEDLEPERSVSATASIQQIIGRTSPLTIDVDAFWTRFSNKIEPDYSVPGEIRYANLDGSATTRGLAVQVQGALTRAFRYTIGGTLLDVFLEDGRERTPLEFAADYQGTATLEWLAPHGFDIDYTARLTGPMALPSVDGGVAAAYLVETGSVYREESPVYTVHNVQVTKALRFGGRQARLYAAVDNLFGYRQSTPIVGFWDGVPGFGDSFDAAYVYGPIQGRRFGLGVRLALP